MGQEIDHCSFEPADFRRYQRCLQEETARVLTLISEHRLSERAGVGGFELEAWLVWEDGRPAPLNDAFLARLGDDLVVAELARYNVELNVDPQAIAGEGLRRLEKALQQRWSACDRAARSLGARMVMTGILPTVRDSDLTPGNMSSLRRYAALNEQVLKGRKGRPMRLDIVGHDHLTSVHHDVMLEAAATSFQVHLQVPAAASRRYYNAAMICSAPCVAIAANAPFLFGKDLWEETRIPLFEQAVEAGGFSGAASGPVRRVTFGSGYVSESIAEVFRENKEHYPPLLPVHFCGGAERLAHLRLHNGTIWRWNRPLLGWDSEGRPHLRIEHRVMAAGPTVVDQMANAAFFYGLVEQLAQRDVAPELVLPFEGARDNFYEAARLGLSSHPCWLDGSRHNMKMLVLHSLLPMARNGLEGMDVAAELIDRYLAVIEERVARECTGSAWQRAFVAKHGRDMAALTRAYRDRSDTGIAVHEWDIG
ncbi:MAG TPA: glutamate--cysteine ligase [Gammaproteobacteria bacterium]|nr:glutamate--cysteine ligase [Gammaproteobacteria bacterium]